MTRRALLTAILPAALLLAAAPTLPACAGGDGRLVIASNADAEVVAALHRALDAGGFSGQYLIQTLGTAELAGKLLAEGEHLEAAIVTMSTYALVSARERGATRFAPIPAGGPEPLAADPDLRPITAQEGAIILNTAALGRLGLPTPKSIRDLADPVYAGNVSVTDLRSSSTAWLLVQALVAAYGEEGAVEILAGIYRNAGPHVESAGSAPLRKVRSGEVALGFGLRHQALADAARGMPVAVVDPAEGTYVLTESVAVIDKGAATDPRAAAMAACLLGARPTLLALYPTPLYRGESVPAARRAPTKHFPQPLTADLLARHQRLADRARELAAK